ncbi:tyrosine-type recombinase/integrase [Leisingera sp. M527]|uniref:tyrosine-type recombinase/integrase n=1 Tax=Leisingera sp. M527 TaxID=2867014 RepID=UPI0021A5D454|nr:tyrosine-type recombinase/integrase [Leisingera sp. M527]
MESGTSICTRNLTMTGVKFLFRVTLRRHDLDAEVFSLKEPVKVQLVLSGNEVKRILVMAPSLKARVMQSLAYGCRLRAGEVVRLKVGDIVPEARLRHDGAQNIIRIVQSKGRKDRNVMLPAGILGLLRDWWKERPTGQDTGVPGPDQVIFPGYGGKHLSARQNSRLFKQAARAAGITKPVTLRTSCRRRASGTLRHSFATHLLERGVDIRVIYCPADDCPAIDERAQISEVESPLDDSAQAKRKKSKKRKKGASSTALPLPKLEVADIFRASGAAYRAANRGRISLGQLKVMSAIERCRTAALGGPAT